MPTSDTASPPARVVVVTGASSGIGQAAADALHDAGWTVIGASRRGGAGSWRHDRVDVTDPAAVEEFIENVAGAYGRIDAVVCCAGAGVAGPVETSPLGDTRQQFEVNYWGTVHVVRAALAHLRAARGRAVIVSSVAGAMGIPFQAAYAASKFALEGWAESLHWEVAPFGVAVTLVQPGNFRTGFTAARRTAIELGPYRDASCRAVTKMERDERAGGDPRKVAKVVLFALEARRPPLLVSVGSLSERSGIWLKRLLPFVLFSRLARRSLTG